MEQNVFVECCGENKPMKENKRNIFLRYLPPHSFSSFLFILLLSLLLPLCFYISLFPIFLLMHVSTYLYTFYYIFLSQVFSFIYFFLLPTLSSYSYVFVVTSQGSLAPLTSSSFLFFLAMKKKKKKKLTKENEGEKEEK